MRADISPRRVDKHFCCISHDSLSSKNGRNLQFTIHGAERNVLHVKGNTYIFFSIYLESNTLCFLRRALALILDCLRHNCQQSTNCDTHTASDKLYKQHNPTTSVSSNQILTHAARIARTSKETKVSDGFNVRLFSREIGRACSNIITWLVFNNDNNG